jgi:hypothetical protein
MLTAFAVLVAGVGVVLLLSSWMGTKSLALPVFVVVLMAAVAWLVRAPVRRAVERALVWMVPRW